MDFVELATEYCNLNVFNSDTRETILKIAALFVSRSGATSLSVCTAKSIASFKNETLKCAQNVTYNGYLRYLRLLGDYGVEEGYWEKNWFRSAKTAPVGTPSKKLISDNTLWVLFHHIRDNPRKHQPTWFWITVIKTLYFTGIRRRQLIHIRRRDVVFSDETSGPRIFLTAKGSKTLREWWIPMSSNIIDDLTALIALTEERLGRTLGPHEPVFNVCRFHPRYQPDPVDPTKMSAQSITDFFKRVNKNAGVKVGAHRFRHTLATKLCNPQEGSPDIFGVQTLLGHTSIQTTRGYVETPISRMETLLRDVELPELAKTTLSSV